MFSWFLLFNWGGKAPNRCISEESGGLTFCFFSEGFYRNILFQTEPFKIIALPWVDITLSLW